MENLHFIQMTILRSLLFKQNLKFADLTMPGVDSETLSYHLKSLIKQGLLQKYEDNSYSLTQQGKQFSADIDVETSLISSRAKLSILVTAVDNSTGVDKYLLIRRLKSPLYGQACFIAGKVKYGEPASITAIRELQEESGLIAREAEFVCFHRQFVNSSAGDFLKDNAFCMFIVKNFEGQIQHTEEAKPFWVTKEEFFNLKDKAYDLNDLFEIITNPPKNRFVEKDFITEVF